MVSPSCVRGQVSTPSARWELKRARVGNGGDGREESEWEDASREEGGEC